MDLQRAQKAEAEVTRLTTLVGVMEESRSGLRKRITELEAERADLRSAFKTVSEVPVTTGGWQECVGLLSRLLALAHDELQKFEDEMCDRDARLDTLEAEVEEYDQLFELQRARMGEADAAWRAAHPGSELVLPDLGDLLTWLLEQRAPT